MSGELDLETVFDSIHPGEAEVLRGLPRHAKRLYSDRRLSSDRVFAGHHGGEMQSPLADAIRKLALPRLATALAIDRCHQSNRKSQITPGDVALLLVHVTAQDFHVAESQLAVLSMRGVSRTDMLLHLFMPVALQLHERWVSDEITFADVILGVGRMQRLLRSPLMPDAPLHQGSPGGAILIAALPGELHGFEACVFEDFFRLADWQAERQTPANDQDLIDRLRLRNVDMVALCVSRETSLGRVAMLVRRMRRESANPQLFIMVGGSALTGHAQTWKRIGADAAVPDGASAVVAANILLRSP
jgi:methanogenic corrinoid protein MtbC1